MKKTEDSAYEPIDDLMIVGVPARTLTADEFEQYAKLHGRDVMLKAFRPARKKVFNDIKKEDDNGGVQPETLTVG